MCGCTHMQSRVIYIIIAICYLVYVLKFRIVFLKGLLMLSVLEALLVMQIYVFLFLLFFPSFFLLLFFHYSRVRIDIMNSLKMRDPYVTIGSFDRTNLFYGVKSFNRSVSFVEELVEEVSKCVANAGSTIIYCTTIKDVEQVFLISSY